MRIVIWIIRLVVFAALLAFAAKNADPVTLKFFFGRSYELPLVVLGFGFFALGAVLGMFALLGTLLRQRHEISRLKREAKRHASASVPATTTQTLPPSVIDG